MSDLPPSVPQPAYEHNGQPVSRMHFYAVACDPRRSVAVEACAGAGKTWMLVSRVVRALLDGCPPHEILAITFTKKAAGEMRQRLHTWLAEFAVASPEQLLQELALRGVPVAGSANNPQALCDGLRGLQRSLLLADRPVQIRTFHGWFAALLRAAPALMLHQMGLPASYELLENDEEAVHQVWPRFYAAVLADGGALDDFQLLVAAHGRSQIHKALQAALQRRVEFSLADAAGVVDASISPFGVLFPALAGLAQPADALASDESRACWHARSAVLGRADGKTAPKAAAAVVDALALSATPAMLAALRKAFFVASEERLTQNLKKFPAAQEAEPELQALCAAQAQHHAWLHHHRMARLTRLLVREFAQLKRDRGWIDMGDVERAAHTMLSDSVLSGWVQQRLDARVRQLLIDEFQDTNPLQWQALHGWLASYAGAGGQAGAAGGPPSVFVVGDPKQSIYRFRGAEPQVFRAAQAFVVGGLGGDRLSCDHTRRNAPAVVQAVNTAMLQAQADSEYAGFRLHTTESIDAGQVQRLPAIARGVEPLGRHAAGGSAGESDSGGRNSINSDNLRWRDSLTTPRLVEEETAALRECRQAAQWLVQQLAQHASPAHGADAAPLRAREVMVLSRRRARLSVMQDALRHLGIATEQPEKSSLGNAPEVQDVVALLDALVSPGHDLSLARALRSPLFGLGDDDLVRIALAQRQVQAATGVRPTWFDLLSNIELNAVVLTAQMPVLMLYQHWLNTLPPHDALNAIYHHGDVVARYAAATPAAQRDTVVARLQALLGAALALDGARYATPYGFVRALRNRRIAAPTLRAVVAETDDGAGTFANGAVGDADGDAGGGGAVRLLTVHGAKGLEASLVLLLDTDSAAPRTETMGMLIDWPGEAPTPLRCLFLVSEARPPLCAKDLLAADIAVRQREELNSLYVAMTRARHRLVLSSVAPARAGTLSWWQRLEAMAQPVEVEGVPEPDHGLPQGIETARHLTRSTLEQREQTAEPSRAGGQPASREPFGFAQPADAAGTAGSAAVGAGTGTRSTDPGAAQSILLRVLPNLPHAAVVPAFQATISGVLPTTLADSVSPAHLTDAASSVGPLSPANPGMPAGLLPPTSDDAPVRIGQAMHRLLEWLPVADPPSDTAATVDASALWPVDDPARRGVAREFALDAAQLAHAVALARKVRGGQGAWAWQRDLLDWHGNEIAITHNSMPLRIDRLVRRRDTGVWWVFDYKSAWQPHLQDALQRQLCTYRDAVQRAYPNAEVQAAFLTGAGLLVPLVSVPALER